MSQENVKAVKAVYDAFNSRDWDRVRAGVAPEIEWHQYTAVPDRTTFRGPDEIIERFLIRQWVADFPDFEAEISEVIDGGETVVVIGTARGRGRGSGVEVRLRFAHMWRLREGKAFEVHDVAAEPRRSGWGGDKAAGRRVRE